MSAFVSVLLLLGLTISAGYVLYSFLPSMMSLHAPSNSPTVKVLTLEAMKLTDIELTAYVRNCGTDAVNLDAGYVKGVRVEGAGYYFEINEPGPDDDIIGEGEVGSITVRTPTGFEVGKSYGFKFVAEDNTQVVFTAKTYPAEVTGGGATLWWNEDYSFRRRLTVSSTPVLPTDYSVKHTLDTTGADFQSDGDDLRVVYWDGLNNIELD